MTTIFPFVNDGLAVPGTMTADTASLLSARGVNGNGHTADADPEPAVMVVYESRRSGRSTAKPRRATGPQMKGEKNLAVKRAEAGLLFRDAFQLTVTEAATSTGSSVAYLIAVRTIQQSGDTAMLNAVRTGAIAPGPAA